MMPRNLLPSVMVGATTDGGLPHLVLLMAISTHCTVLLFPQAPGATVAPTAKRASPLAHLL